MKLFGSMTEHAFRNELMRTHADLFNHLEGTKSNRTKLAVALDMARKDMGLNQS